MAKAKTPNQKKAYERLNKRLAKYVAKVRAVYDTLNLEASKIATRTDYDVEQGKPFRWSDYPQTTAQVKKLQQRFVNDIGVIIMSGTSEEWANSNELQDLLADKVMKAYNVKRGDSRTKKYYQVNNDALQAFQQRRDNGMNLSDRLWNQAEDYKKGLEATLSTAIERGMSAVVLSKRVSKYLRDFDSLKKGYKKRFGTATDIHDCEYRSARLARSEINMAYRNAEQLRWQQMDFILGYEIKLSHSHPCHDICDDLKGRYPKDFKWTGWHPNDLCYVIPIIKTEEQFWLPESERGKDNAEITDVPQGFKTWVANNQDKIARAEKRGTLPYFVRDNRERVKILKNTKKIEYLSLKNDSLINNKPQFSNIDYTIKSKGTISANNNVEKGIILEGNLSQEDAVNILRGLCNKYTHEEAIAFLDDGRIFYKKGVLGEVPLDEDEKMLLKNSIFMHNHPETTFSPNDILTSIKYGFKEIHVVTSTHKYIAITSDFDLSKSSLFKVREMYNDALSIVYDKIMSSNSKIADKIRMNMQLYEIEEFLRLLGIRYIIKPL